jgi:cell division cycle 20-like protein 1 (cofactor of APC complex)
MAIDGEVADSSYPTDLAKASNAFNTPPIATPPRSSTPPPAIEKRKSESKGGVKDNRFSGIPGGEAIDATALRSALKDFEDAGRQRDVTPGGSPSRKRQRVYGDR